MATANNAPLTIDSRSNLRIWITLLGAAIILASFATPWWTRGFTIKDDSDSDAPVAEGMYVHYGPFRTGSAFGVSTDSSREAVTGLLGVLMVGATLFSATSLGVRYLRTRGTLECSPNVHVAFSIAAFSFGIAAVLTGILFVPLFGTDGGFMWGDEVGGPDEGSAFGLAGGEFTRYGNAGMYFGIVGLVGFPLYLWVDAARSRDEEVLGTNYGTSTGTGNASADSLAKPKRKPTPSLE